MPKNLVVIKGALAKISANSKRMYMDAVMVVFLFSDGLCVILTC